MPKTYSGHLFTFESEDGSEVTKAIVSSQRISIDWNNDGEPGHLEAQYDERECLYKGHFGVPRLDSDQQIELRLYTASNGDRLLLGNYWVVGESERTCCFFRLSPDQRDNY